MMDPDAARLRESVREAYSAAATDPGGRHPFPVGAQFARSVGYPAALLDSIPGETVDGFAGVSNVSVFAPLPPGGTIVDLGCGSGLDALAAARRVGPEGRVIGIDFSAAMLNRANASLRRLGWSNVVFLQAAAERLPLPDASVDQALVNGIFNLNPFRAEIFRELARIVRPGGSVFGAEIVLRALLPAKWRLGGANWFS